MGGNAVIARGPLWTHHERIFQSSSHLPTAFVQQMKCQSGKNMNMNKNMYDFKLWNVSVLINHEVVSWSSQSCAIEYSRRTHRHTLTYKYVCRNALVILMRHQWIARSTRNMNYYNSRWFRCRYDTGVDIDELEDNCQSRHKMNSLTRHVVAPYSLLLQQGRNISLFVHIVQGGGIGHSFVQAFT